MKNRFFRFGLIGSIFLSVPFYFLWNYFAPIYGPQMPPMYQHLPFWHCVGLFAMAAILRILLLPW
jgi:hypothetical protein